MPRQKATTEYTYTQVVPVVVISDAGQLRKIMGLWGVPRKLTYQKLGSLNGWGLDWKKADQIVRTMMQPADIRLPSKLWEWSVNDTMKAIEAQQEAAKTFLIRKIDQHSTDLTERKKLSKLLSENPTGNNWLHRQFRKQYIKGRTYIKNQMVYQGGGYKALRLTRNTEIQGLQRGKRITLKVRCRHVISGQIRVILKESGKFEVHCVRKKSMRGKVKKPTKIIGQDLGYTEAFYTSAGESIGKGLGKLLTVKSNRQCAQNRNRYRLRCHAKNNRKKAANILKNNLGYKTKAKRRAAAQATIKNLIRRDLRRSIQPGTQVYCEDLSYPIKSKTEFKRLNNRLNNWIKGAAQDSLEAISRETGSTVSVVNPTPRSPPPGRA